MEKLIHNEGKKFYIFGPSGISFDNKNDDLIVFDLGIFRRLHCREDRKLLTNQPKFQFLDKLKEMYLKGVENYETRKLETSDSDEQSESSDSD